MAELNRIKKKYEAPTLEIEEVGGGNRYSLPYGLCKGVGIDTDGMTPREAWQAYTDKTGKSKAEAEKEHWGKSESEGKEKKEEGKEKIKSRKEALEYVRNNLKMRPLPSLKNIPDEVLIPNVKRLGELEEKFKAIYGQDIELRSTKTTTTIASCSIIDSTGKTTRLTLSSFYFSDAELLKRTKKKAVESGWSVPVADDMLLTSTVTHEYGHILFEKLVHSPELNKKLEEMREEASKTLDYVAIIEMNENRKKLIADSCKNIVSEIKKIAQTNNPKIDLSAQMGTYGKSNDLEWLAEAFANSQCGAPNEIGKATIKYLKEKGFKV